MRILCVTATPFEIIPLIHFLNKHGIQQSPDLYAFKSLEIQVLTTGVGLMQTAFHLSQFLGKEKPDLLINLGVAGAFDKKLKLCEVVEVVSERIGDLGAEDANADFLDLNDLGLNLENSVPGKNGLMKNPDSQSFSFLKKVNGLSVNKVHGEINSIQKIKSKYPEAQVESMEGAAFFYACLNEKIPFLEIRSISNYVEPRNKANWKLPEAINSLNEVVIELINSIT